MNKCENCNEEWETSHVCGYPSSICKHQFIKVRTFERGIFYHIKVICALCGEKRILKEEERIKII